MNVKVSALTIFKFNLKMKLTALLLLIALFGMRANSTYAQKTKISLNFSDVTIQRVLDNIESNTEFRFFVNVKEVNVDEQISIEAHNQTVDKILKRVFKNQDVGFKIVDNQIILGSDKKPGYVQLEISGTVQDIDGVPLPGATILEKGTTNGTQSDFDGNFSITLSNQNSVLRISYIGFVTKEIVINNQSNIKVVLEEDSEALEEVVVTGYTSQKKADITGAVSTINVEEQLGERPSANINTMLQGSLPGLTLGYGTDGGEPGSTTSIMLRGQGTLTDGASDPYILVDGIPFSAAQLNSLSPNDVREVTILKDAAAAAIYGSRGAFGVVLITTKRGGIDAPLTVEYTSTLGFSSPINFPKVVGSLEHLNSINVGSANSNQGQRINDLTLERARDYVEGRLTTEAIAPTDPNATDWQSGWSNNNWYDIFFKKSNPTIRHDLAVSGGSAKTQYNLSGSYFTQDGSFRFVEDSYKRVNLRSYIKTNVSDWLSFDFNSSYGREKRVFPNGGFGPYDKRIIFHQISRAWPTEALYAPNGDILSNDVNRLIGSGDAKNYINTSTFQVGIDVEPLDNWITRLSYSWKLINANDRLHKKTGPRKLYDGSVNNLGYPFPSLSRTFGEENNVTVNLISDYTKEIEKHKINVQGGYEMRVNKLDRIEAEREVFITSTVPTLEEATSIPLVNDDLNHYTSQGVFGRLSYTFDERYAITFTGRYDGSSFFQEGQKWGFFPAISAGYTISNENFWDPLLGTIDYLKFRASWGSLGNHHPQFDGTFEPRYATIAQTNWLFDGKPASSIQGPNIISNSLTWETVETTNIGLDARLFSNRLSIEAEWFRRINKDMIGPAESLPAVLGSSVPSNQRSRDNRKNNTELETTGWELTLNWRDKINEKLSYNIGVNVFDNIGTVTKYTNANNFIGSSGNNYYSGRKLGEVWGYETLGYFTDDNDVANSPDQSFIFNRWGAGDIKYKDLNNDGKIDNGTNTLDDTGDRKIIANTTPRFNYGINLGMNYKNFGLAVFMQGVGKKEVFFPSNTNLFYGFRGSIWQNTYTKASMDYWTPENTNAYYPKPYLDGEHTKNTEAQSKYIDNGAYLRVKNIQLSYNLPESVLSQIGANRIKLFVSGENLFTFTKLNENFDPELTATFGNYGPGKIYPLNAIYSFGLNVSF